MQITDTNRSSFTKFIFSYNLIGCILLPLYIAFDYFTDITSTNCPLAEGVCWLLFLSSIPLGLYLIGALFTIPAGVYLAIKSLNKKVYSKKIATKLLSVSILLFIIFLISHFLKN